MIAAVSGLPTAGGRIEVRGQDKGAGFAVSPRVVVTANHLVRNQDSTSLAYVTRDGHKIPILRIDQDEELDVAVLHLGEDAAEVFRVGQPTSSTDWRVEMHPRPKDAWLSGTVTAIRRPYRNSQGHDTYVTQLQVEQDLQEFEGYSGSPVVLAAEPDVAFGVLVEQLRVRLARPVGDRIPASNVLYATPLQDVIERFRLNLPVLPPLGQQPNRERRLERLHDTEFRAHWSPISRGVEEGATGSYFTGRTAALQRVVRWLRSEGGSAGAPSLLIVTGEPGSGKSAVIGRVVTLAYEKARQQIAIQNAPEDSIPPVGSFDAVVYARAKSYDTILGELTAALRLQADHESELLDALNERSETFVIAADALNEAVKPDEVANLFRKIGRTASARVLIATRRSLLDRLGTAKEIIDLDDPQYFDRNDIEVYVTERLLATHDRSSKTPYLGREDTARAVAAQVTEAAGRNFLIARLVAQALVDRSEPVDVQHHQFPSSVRVAFEEYLNTFGDETDRVRDLLEPLAWAEGKGMPTRRIWPEIASRLSGKQYGPADVRWLTDKAGDLLTRDTEDDRPVFRLFHETLAEHLRRPDDQSKTDVQGDIVDALLRTVSPPTNGLRWVEADPYVRRYLAIHAAAAQRIDELVLDAYFLAAAEPRNLLPALRSCVGKDARSAAMVYRAMAHELLSIDSVPERLSYIELGAIQCGLQTVTDQITQSPSLPWRAHWARWRAAPGFKLTDPYQVATAATRARRSGEKLLAYGLADGTVLFWNESQRRYDELSLDHGATITALTATRVAGIDAIVSGAADGTICVWNLVTGANIFRWGAAAELSRPSFSVSSLTSSIPDEDSEPVPADSTFAFTLEMPGPQIPLRPAEGTPILAIVDLNSDSRKTVTLPPAFKRTDSFSPPIGWRHRPIALSSYQDQGGQISFVCSVGYGLAVIQPGNKNIRTIETVAEGQRADDDVDSSSDETRSTTDTSLPDNTKESAVVTAISCAMTSGSTVIVAGNDNGEIRLLESQTLNNIPQPSMIHPYDDGPPTITALSRIDGLSTATVAAGDSEGRVLFWDLENRHRIGDEVEFESEVTAIEFFRSGDGGTIAVLTAGGSVWLIDTHEIERFNRDPSKPPKPGVLSPPLQAELGIFWAQSKDGWVRGLNIGDGSERPDLKFGSGAAKLFAPADVPGSMGILSSDGESTVVVFERSGPTGITRTTFDVGSVPRTLFCRIVESELCLVTGGDRIQAWRVAGATPRRFAPALKKNRAKPGFVPTDSVEVAELDGEWCVLAIVGSRVIRRWRLNDGQVIEPDLVLGTRPWDVSIGYGGSDINDTQLMTLVSVASDPAMVIAGDVRGWLWGWSFRTGTLEFQGQVHLGAVAGLAVMNREPSGALISGGATDGHIVILEPPGKEVATIRIGSPIVSVASVGEDIIVATSRGWVALCLGDV